MSGKVDGVMIPDNEAYAFPWTLLVTNERGQTVSAMSPGMTLRDYFAGVVIGAVLAAPTPPTGNAADAAASSAYAIADAMIRAREAK
jgi:hypothetical protein